MEFSKANKQDRRKKKAFALEVYKNRKINEYEMKTILIYNQTPNP